MTKQTYPVFITVQHGCVTSITDAEGRELPAIVIDYDVLENGACPVCHDEPMEYHPAAGNLGAFSECLECGYRDDKDNALPAAVAYLKSNPSAAK